MSARKITRENYQIIRRFALSNSVGDTVQRFGISAATVSNVKSQETFDDYVSLLNKYSETTKANAKRGYAQRHNKFNTYTPEKARELRANGPFGKYAKPNKPQELSSPFSPAQGFITINKVETKEAKSTEQKEHKRGGFQKKPNPITNDKFAMILELAPTGKSKREIAEAVGFTSDTMLMYNLGRTPSRLERFEEEYAKGEAKRLENRKAWLEEARKKSMATAEAKKVREKKVDQTRLEQKVVKQEKQVERVKEEQRCEGLKDECETSVDILTSQDELNLAVATAIKTLAFGIFLTLFAMAFSIIYTTIK